MGRCCVPECKTKSTVGLHVFPANQKIAKKWVRFTRTFHLNFKKITEYRVCRAHFKPSDRLKNISGNNCLKENAVPCLLLPPDLSFETEHNYDWDYKFQKGEGPTPKSKHKPRQYLSKKKFVVMSNAILTNDPIFNNIGNEVVIGDEPKAEPVILDPHVMLREALNRIHTLEEKLLKKSKEKASLAAKLRINGKKIKKMKQILEGGGTLNGGKIMKYLQEQNYSKPLIEFLFMQIKNKNRTAKGYRYSDEQKSLALAIYKQGPKCYRFLQRIFILPCKRTLGRHSAHLILETGIDQNFFEYLKDKVAAMPESDKPCTISWDEMSLKANLNYNQQKDEIDGLVELDGVRRPAFATHSLTFMVRGINAPYKQPVTFFYTNGLKSCELAALVTLVTEAVLETDVDKDMDHRGSGTSSFRSAGTPSFRSVGAPSFDGLNFAHDNSLIITLTNTLIRFKPCHGRDSPKYNVKYLIPAY